MHLGCPWMSSEITEISFNNNSNILVFISFIDRKIAGGFREEKKKALNENTKELFDPIVSYICT